MFVIVFGDFVKSPSSNSNDLSSLSLRTSARKISSLINWSLNFSVELPNSSSLYLIVKDLLLSSFLISSLLLN